ncbi:MAG: aminotransferase class III-fold pyridoxal phosphate-dependent enzyme [Pararhodobacter sp.]|nr:aminotransferase class III-fold pyridoxal phosphate-dependent enzyme [Pararhodobacter sp.]
MKIDTDDFVSKSLDWRTRALKSVAYGTSSTPRGNQKPAPLVAARASGAHVWDISGQRFIDYALGFGPLILGHSPEGVIQAVIAELGRGLRTATIHRGEAQLGELIAQTLPSAELSAFVSSGSEAVQLALRIARATTGRTRIIRFRGNYHGWFDSVHSGGRPGNDGPDTLGQDPAATASSVLLDWGDLDMLRATLTRDFAAVLLEPVAVNGGCFMPPDGFLEGLRAITREMGVMLIFDEVISGYRLSLGGAQARLSVTPDLSVIGKAMGAGFPISAVAGSAAAMEPVASGRLLHRGTFNGNPVSVAAAVACITYLRDNAAWLYPRMEAQASELAGFIDTEARAQGLAMSVRQAGSALQLFPSVAGVTQLSDAGRMNRPATDAFAADLMAAGVQIIGRGLMYLSSEHTDTDIAETKAAFAHAIAAAVRRDL